MFIGCLPGKKLFVIIKDIQGKISTSDPQVGGLMGGRGFLHFHLQGQFILAINSLGW